MKKMVSVILSLCLVLSLAAANAEMVLRFATDSSEEYVSTVQIYKFAEEVKEKTEGRIVVEVYAGGQLGEEKVCVEQVQMGALDMTKSSMGALTGFNEELNLLSLPYLFKSPDHLWAVMDSEIGQHLLDSMGSKGLVGLGWLDAGSRCFYATKPLESVDSFKNMKFRVMQSSIYQDTVSALGGIPISMSGGDVYSALQTGLVDGAENNIPRIIDMSHNELCKYLILDRHNIMPEMVIMSASTWNRLSEADQQIIRECVGNLQANMIEAWGATEAAALETLAAGGMTIVEPDAETIAAMRAAEQTVYDQYGAQYAELIAQIESIEY